MKEKLTEHEKCLVESKNLKTKLQTEKINNGKAKLELEKMKVEHRKKRIMRAN